jgi:hypothetical protein
VLSNGIVIYADNLATLCNSIDCYCQASAWLHCVVPHCTTCAPQACCDLSTPLLTGTQFRVFHIIAEYEDHGIWAQWSGEAWNMDMSIFTPWTQTEEFGQSTS